MTKKNNFNNWKTLLIITLILLLNFNFAYDVGNGYDGNLYFSTTTKSYGTMTSSTDYNVIGNTLYLSLDKDYNFSNFYLGAGTTLTTTDTNGVVLLIRSQNDLIIAGTITLNNILFNGNITKNSYNGILRAGVANGGKGGHSSFWASTAGIQGAGFGGGGGAIYVGASGDNAGNGGYPFGTPGTPGDAYRSGVGVTQSNGVAGTGYSRGRIDSAIVEILSCGGTCTLSATSGVAGNNYGVSGGNASCGGSSTGSMSYYQVASGGSGAGGLAGKGGINFYAYSNNINITGTINTSGTNGGNGGNGGQGKVATSGTFACKNEDAYSGMGGGGGGGGNAGNIYLKYWTSYSNTGTTIMNGGVGGLGGTNAESGTTDYPEYEEGLVQATNGTNGTNGSLTNLLITETKPTPSTTLTIIPILSTIDTNLNFVCTNNNFDCNIYYRINEGGWYNTINDNNYYIYSGTGTNKVDYYAMSSLGTTEMTITEYFTTYGVAKFTLFDETSGNKLNNVNWSVNPSINGNSGGTLTDSNTFYLDLNGITTQGYTFTFSKDGYTTRTYTTDLNQFSEIDINFALLQNGTNYPLLFKHPTTNETMIGAIVEITTKGKTIGRLKTNSEGRATIDLNSDELEEYTITVYYQGETFLGLGFTNLTIKIPLDERTGETITPFNATITGFYSAEYNDQNNDFNVTVLSSSGYYYITISDSNGNYAEETFGLLLSNHPNYTLQPYLLKIEEAAIVNIKTLDDLLAPVSGVNILIYKYIGGTKTLLGSYVSGADGSTPIIVYAGQIYTMEAYYEGKLVFETENFVPTSATYYLYISLSAIEVPDLEVEYLNVEFNPNTRVLTGNITATIIGKPNYYRLRTFKDDIYYDSGILNYTTDTITKTQADLNVTDINDFTYQVILYYGDSNYARIFNKTYVKGSRVPAIDIVQLFTNARLDFGCTTDTLLPCPLTTIASIILTLFILAALFLGFARALGLDIKAYLLIATGILFFFTYVGWFYWLIFWFMVFVIAFIMARRVSE